MYKRQTLDKLKKELIDIFEVFDSLCKKYDIKYFATGGTLLGVVRHGGCIPWDDDLDTVSYTHLIKMQSLL